MFNVCGKRGINVICGGVYGLDDVFIVISKEVLAGVFWRKLL